MKTPGEQLFYEVKTQEQGQNYILELIHKLETARGQCDVITEQGIASVETGEKAWDNLRLRYGQTLGALVTLMHCRVLNDETYNQLRQRVDMALLPKTIKTVSA